jgi:hypothetical protein
MPAVLEPLEVRELLDATITERARPERPPEVEERGVLESVAFDDTTSHRTRDVWLRDFEVDEIGGKRRTQARGEAGLLNIVYQIDADRHENPAWATEFVATPWKCAGVIVSFGFVPASDLDGVEAYQWEQSAAYDNDWHPDPLEAEPGLVQDYAVYEPEAEYPVPLAMQDYPCEYHLLVLPKPGDQARLFSSQLRVTQGARTGETLVTVSWEYWWQSAASGIVFYLSASVA